MEHHLLWPAQPFREERSILVAGCGTSQAARYALGNPNATVVAIDISDTSIEHTRELAERHQLTNLTVRRMAVEDAEKLDERFDQIVCTGVLHHLADPDRGLKTLANVLAPGGAMHLMVYARYGRTGISMIRRYGQLLGLTPSDSDITELMAALEDIPAGHPLSHLLGRTPDFEDRSALADALLNPRERTYSVPELMELIEGAGLAFGRWLRQAPYLPHCGLPATVPHAPRIAALDPIDQYAAVELFRGTIMRHSAIIHHRDEMPAAQPLAGASGMEPDWRDYVPLVPPAVRTVTERDRLPSGAAAAMLNGAHEHRDLVLLVDERSLEIFQSVDGRHAIGDMVDPEEIDAAVELFLRLWQHDLVVIDASSVSRR